MGSNKRTASCLLSILLVLVMMLYYSEDWGSSRHSAPVISNSSSGLHNDKDKTALSLTESIRERQWKSILVWNGPPDRVEVESFGTGHEAFVRQNCEISDCEIVVNRSQRWLGSFDAIVFNIPVLRSLKRLNRFRSGTRRPQQVMVFFTQESPSYAWSRRMDASLLTDFFNWTMTYRLDADVPLLYGRIRPKSSAPKTLEQTAKSIREYRHNVNVSTSKTKLVAWMVSHCSTDGGREHYVERLQRFIDVDIYGDCGTMSCDRTWDFSSDGCYQMIEQKYKFYLSFENSICSDYVTEKFFHAASRHIVPVVYGGADYEQFAPPHSYIDARSFKPRQLAAYLRALDANETLYNQYFWWKEHYTIEAGLVQMARHGFCDLCKKLHLDQGAVRVLPNMSWSAGDHCLRPGYRDKPETFVTGLLKMFKFR